MDKPEAAEAPTQGEDPQGPPPEVTELVGQTIGSYKLTHVLGYGGMGAVYLGEHPKIGSHVAIKVLHAQFSNSAKTVERFFAEARAVNVIGHHNIVKILDLNTNEAGRHYFIMEYLVGQPLSGLLDAGPLELGVLGPIVLQACSALQAAHERGIIHRDLKPDNIYLISHLSRRNVVKIVDFGIAKLMNKEELGFGNAATQTGNVMGTPYYMSPEQAMGDNSVIDARSDIYSMGVILFHLSTGELPFDGPVGQIMVGHIHTEPPAPRSLNPKVDKGLEAIILKAMSKHPDDRYQTMQELGVAVLELLNAKGLPAEAPTDDSANEDEPTRSVPGMRTPRATTGKRSSPSLILKRKKKNRGILLGAGAVAVVVAGAFVVLRPAPKPAPVPVAPPPQPAAAAVAPPAPAQSVKVFVVVADAEGADVTATWSGQEHKAKAPAQLEVPRGATVVLHAEKEGRPPVDKVIIADAKSGFMAVTLTMHK